MTSSSRTDFDISNDASISILQVKANCKMIMTIEVSKFDDAFLKKQFLELIPRHHDLLLPMKLEAQNSNFCYSCEYDFGFQRTVKD